MSSQVKRGGKVWKAVVGVISTVLVVGLFVALLVLTASGRWVDSVSSDSASVSHAVSQRRITAYCPSRMTLPDASAYGDSKYQPSERRHLVFGRIRRVRSGVPVSVRRA